MAGKGQQLNKARQQLIETFLACLEEKTLPWRKGWTVVGLEPMHNPISKTRYKGVNALLLMFVAHASGYDDSRWCTFNQAKEKGWNVKKGSKGVPVEYWSYYDKKNKKNISFNEYSTLMRKKEREQEDFVLVSRTFTVFNGCCIDGIPALEKNKVVLSDDIEMNHFIENIKDNMAVGYREFGNSAYYTPATDVVTMPPREQFKSQCEFDSTLLHELSHATGHESRLNREIRNPFGSENYAIEELRAEMSSVFLSQYLNIDMGEDTMNNHKAYIQSWAKDLKDDPNILFRAIKDGETIADYLIEKGERERDILKGEEVEMEDTMEVLSLDDKMKKAQDRTKRGTVEKPRCKQMELC